MFGFAIRNHVNGLTILRLLAELRAAEITAPARCARLPRSWFRPLVRSPARLHCPRNRAGQPRSLVSIGGASARRHVIIVSTKPPLSGASLEKTLRDRRAHSRRNHACDWLAGVAREGISRGDAIREEGEPEVSSCRRQRRRST